MKIKIAATQMSCGWEIEENISKAINLIHKAAEKGANIILLQELFQTPYFCIQYDEEIFKLAHTFEDNKVLDQMRKIAKDLNLNLSHRPEELSCEMFYKITMKYEELAN